MNPCNGVTHSFIAYVLLLNYFIVCHIYFINFLLLIMLLYLDLFIIFYYYCYIPIHTLVPVSYDILAIVYA